MVYITDKTAIGTAVHANLQAILGSEHVKWAPNPVAGQPGDVIVAAIDSCRLDRLDHWERIARDAEMNLISIQVHGGEVVIGPEVRPRGPGCLRCWATRYFAGRGIARRFTEMTALSGVESAQDPWLTPLAVSIVGLLASQQVICALHHDSHPPDDSGWKVYYFDLQTLTGREWNVLPDSSCSRCADLPLDSAEKARLRLESRTKPHPRTDRLRSTSELGYVCDLYVGHRANIVSDIAVSWPLKRGVVVTVAVPLTEWRPPEPCSGFSSRYSDARTVAILEGLERYSGVRPRASRPSVQGSFSSLRDVAVDPRCFGLPSEREYKANPKFLTPYNEQLEMEFVWAYSLRQKRPVLVPRQLGFYSTGTREGPFFVIEGSVGCAIGSCPEECILHGILEVVERDAFLLTWYARLKRPHLNAMECRDPETRYYYRHLQAEGFDISTLDVTTDFGIPAVCVVARRREHKMPYAACAGAAHLHPEQAIKKAFRELSGIVGRYTIELSSENMRQRALRLAEDPAKVRTMMDHALFYCVPESGPYLEFLTTAEKRTSLEEMEAHCRELWSQDLGEELNRTIERIIAVGSDVLAVDQTAPEQLLGGLRTFKTLIPDAIPMTWGQHLRRLEGLRRLDAALERKTDEARVVKSEPNPIPHPYP